MNGNSNAAILPETFVEAIDSGIKNSSEENQLFRTNRSEFSSLSDINEELKLEITYFYKHTLIALAIHFIHALFGPISIPLLWWLFGKNLCTNMGFNWHPFYKGEFMAWSWIFYTINFLIFNSSQFMILLSLILATKTIIVIKTILVSIKYGFYTKEFWQMMNDEELELEVLRSQLILVGWRKIPSDIILHEILKSFGRCSRSPDELCIVFETEISKEFKDLINKSKSGYNIEIRHDIKYLSHADNKPCIPTMVFAQILIDFSVPKSISRADNWLPELIGLFYGLSPILSIFIQFGAKKLEFGIAEIFYVFYSLYLAYHVAKVFIKYIITGIVDMRRKKFLMSQISALISKRETYCKILKEYKIPRLDFNDIRTIDSWYTMRTAFLDFGKRYTYRIFIYASLIFPLCTLIISFLIIQFFGMIQIISIPAMIGVIFLAFTSLSLIFWMILIGSQINDTINIHRDFIVEMCSNILHLRNTENGLDNKVYQALNLVDRKLEQDEKVRPVKIMGLTADSKFLSKIFALLTSGVLSLFQVYLKKN
ncbi:unnamed protein product [Blepharisma stoltei]|uniref:Odorant receptor n=1 Tax=Blepharisma stoltei TaxID=1481888 RepID=A0AAU9IQX2_9CILI|nr:unnamed protein product [Blepharisma stoltei]